MTALFLAAAAYATFVTRILPPLLWFLAAGVLLIRKRRSIT